MTMSDVKTVFANMEKRFESGADLGDLSAVYLFKFGEESGDWTINIVEGNGTISEGAIGEPTCTITMSASDFVEMVEGSSNAQQLFMMGKLKVAGNMGQALKLQKILG